MKIARSSLSVCMLFLMFVSLSAHAGMKVDRAERLKDLEAENARLKRAVADLTVGKLILKEVAEEKY